MADKKISALTGATTPLAGTEVLPIVQGGNTVKVSVDNLTTGKAVSTGALTSTGNINFNGGTFRFNSAKADLDFNVSGDTDDNLIYCDASTDQVGFGRNNPGAKIDVEGAAIVRGNVTITGAFIPGANISAPSADAFVYRSADNTLALGTANAARFVIDVSGNATVSTGNLVIGTAGKGIDFSANTHAAGMTSELLNDYEEGTWTPNQGSGLTVVGDFSSTGRYTRVGNQVTITGTLSGAGSIALAGPGIIFTNIPYAIAGPACGSMNSSSLNSSGAITAISGATVYGNTSPAVSTIYFAMTYLV